MAKVYVFGIGGTGSRVIKSLTLLCAAGIETNGFDIVPIIIDPDEANGDVTRTVELLKNYVNVRERLDFTGDSNKFFKTGIRPVADDFRMPLTDVNDGKFRHYIDYGSLDRKNKALASLLFSEDNLEAEMNVGFKGNPNIGSVVLNQFSRSEYFKQFANSFQNGDRIFIISSIFGGTGAAGFPLIVKNLRELEATFPNRALIKTAPIGAITVLPYFGVTADENSKIDKSTFISKTKAALTYYRRNISGNKSLNALYYIGDDITNDYENKEGSTGQQNDAHFVELAAALSILDFTQISGEHLSNSADANGRFIADNPLYKEFGIESDDRRVTFLSLAPDPTQITLKKPLTQYFLFVKYLDEHIRPEGLTKVWARGVFDERFLREPFYSSYLRNVNIHFKEWIAELARNDRSFSPFKPDTGKKNLFHCVRQVNPKAAIFQADNYAFYDAKLNGVRNNDTGKEQKFVSLFYGATEQIVEQKFNFR